MSYSVEGGSGYIEGANFGVGTLFWSISKEANCSIIFTRMDASLNTKLYVSFAR